MFDLVVIDLDGTLIRSDLTVGEDTVCAIRRAKERGVRVTFATGRMISASAHYIDVLGVELPVVALNGALVGGRGGNDVIFHKPLPRDDFERVLPALAESRAAVTLVYGDSSCGWNIDPAMCRKLSSWITGISAASPAEVPREPTIALIAGDEAKVRETADRIRSAEARGLQLFVFPSIRFYPMWYAELRAAGVDKGVGLRALRQALGIPKEKVLVIGDFLNDLPMFAEAGLKAAVANSHNDVIAAADYVSPLSNDQDAVAEIIERFVL